MELIAKRFDEVYSSIVRKHVIALASANEEPPG